MARVDLANLGQKDLDRLGADIGRVGSLIYSILQVARNMDPSIDSSPIEALCEKAGFLSDRCVKSLGGIGMCGSWEDWAGLNHDGDDEKHEDPEFQRFLGQSGLGDSSQAAA